MAVYVDLIFLTNVFFDSAILMVTAKVRGVRLQLRRAIAAVLLGAAYVLLMFNPAFSVLYTAASKLIFSLLVVYIAFGYGHLRLFAHNAGVFYIVHFAVAGAMFAAHFLLLSSGDVFRRLLIQPPGTVAFAVDSGLWLSLPVFLLSLWLCRSVFEAKARSELVLASIAEVSVEIGGVVVTCNGLIDTGNQLYDPLTRMPVLVMESSRWQHLLPPAWLRKIARREADRLFAGPELNDFPWPDRLRLVPYRGINGGSAFMLALKPDKVVIACNERRYEQTRVLVAFDGGTLAAGGQYQAIIHPMLVQA